MNKSRILEHWLNLRAALGLFITLIIALLCLFQQDDIKTLTKINNRIDYEISVKF